MTWLWTLLWLAFAGPPTSLDGRAVATEVDRIVSGHIASTKVPGVVVAVTEGERVVMVRGWGVADLESGEPMDPDTTLVRIASLSKTFTATAVAQLEDAGKLDVDADVDDYLARVSTAGRFEAPVTVRHLLAHTSGFINFNSGRVSRSAPHPEDFEAFVARTMPPRMHPPGTATLYTNHGNALAGLVVQDVAGVPFAEYVQDHVLAPLSMDDTHYYLDAHQPGLARSYEVDEDGNVTPWPYEYFQTIPASAVHTTARDMTAYLMLHAGHGRVGGREVLSPAAMQRMRTPHPTVHAALPEYHYAFAPVVIKGHRGRAHGGSVPAFLSRMVVFDDAGVGVFVAQNAFGPNVADEVIEAVAAALPTAAAQRVEAAGDGRPQDGTRLAGDYRVLDKHETAAFTRPFVVLAQDPMKVRIDGDGFVEVDGKRYLRTGELVFHAEREDGGLDTLVFVPGDDGAIAWVHENRRSAYRTAWHAAREVQVGAWLVALGLMVFGLSGARKPHLPQGQLWTGLALAAIVGAAGPHLFALILDRGQPVYTHPLRFGTPAWLDLVRWAPRAVALLGIAMLVRPKMRHRPGVLITVGAALWVALEEYWRAPPPGLS